MDGTAQWTTLRLPWNRDGLAYEVEFTTLDGRTAAVVTVEAAQVRPVGGREITHAREMALA
jgi:hypothetical protein